MKKLLIIDGNEPELKSMGSLLADTYCIRCCTCSLDAYTLLQTEKFDFILLDLSTEAESGIITIMTSLKSLCPGTLLLCIGASIPASIIVLAIKNGAHDFVEKPLNAISLRAKLLSMEAKRLASTDTGCPTDLFEQSPDYRVARPAENPVILGHSKIIRSICETIRLFAKHAASVLILGESGTGKELAAGEIHRQSRRNNKPFIAADCGSIPEHLAESYLFGTECGAFTGATKRKGFFEAAEGGSLFLDELGILALPIQAKLLRVLETRTGSRMGSLQINNYDVRLISATNAANLNDNVVFRRDLLQRVNTLVLEMPPLRVHLEDIPEMATSFLGRFDCTKTLTSLAMQKLCEWHWPGNVRELKNVIEKAVVLSDTRDKILPGDILTDIGMRWGGMQQRLHL